MLLLATFALIAGAVTAISPCVLPVLPALLAAGGSGGRRRPLGLVAGLTTTFFVTIVGLASVVNGVGVADESLRALAIAVLIACGVAVAVPAVAHRLATPLARLTRLGPRTRGDGFWSGAGVGAALGFVYAPCAGPILAGVIAVAATQGASRDVVVVGAAYAAGSGVTLLALALAGRRLLNRVRATAASRGPLVQRALGAVMIATAAGMALDLDLRFQEALADDLPAFVSNPTTALERSSAVEDRLRDLRGAPRFEAAARASALPDLGMAPGFVGTQRWVNGPELELRELRGRVVLIDFWTYTCINCIRTLPFLRALDRRYRGAGLTIVGVHTPEFAFERDPDNVAAAIRRNRLRYPVVQDNDYATWEAWGNRFWPAKYLVDAGGHVRYVHFGEGAYEETEAAVRALLVEAGAKRLAAARAVAVERAAAGVETAETYLGAARAERFLGRAPRVGIDTYPRVPPGDLPSSHFALSGTWRVDEQAASAVRDARVDARIRAKEAYVVLASRDRVPRRVRVLVDGRPAPSAVAAVDVRAGYVTVRDQRLYRLVSLPRVRAWHLALELEPGVSAYAFTFG